MRLVTPILSGLLCAALTGQVPELGRGPRFLPWQTGSTPPWQPLESVPLPLPGPIAPSALTAPGTIKVQISDDGTLEIWDSAGVRMMRTGLPGRPHRVWRDGGFPLPRWNELRPFPQQDPLSQGLGGLDWNAGDFRSSLHGLLWILEDGERVLTVVHPATGQVIYLTLPRGEDFDLLFEPTRLVLKAGQGAGSQAWGIPWLALLPQFARLGPSSTPPVLGTALKPFPAGQ